MAYRRTASTTARLAAVRERILAETARCVAEGGWGAVTVARVAQAAGVATGTVYRHVPGRDELLTEVFRRAAGRELAAVCAAAERPGPARERIEACLRTFAERALRGPRLAYALLAEPAAPVVEAERLAFRRAYRALFAGLVRDGISAGELPEHDPEVAAAVFTGAVGEALVGPLAPLSAGNPPGAVVDDVVAWCLRAIPRYEGAADVHA